MDGVSFSVDMGQIVSVLGPSGCGKTTILRLIAGFAHPEEGGEIRISGEDMSRFRPYERNIGFVFQDYALFPHMSVEENIAFGPKERGVPRRDIPGRIRRALELVRLSGFEKRAPHQLSGGEQQRVALARALVTEPTLLLLDEPLSNLDAKLREELRIELKEILAAARTTTIIVTHDQVEAMSLADHIIIMNKGRVMQRGSPEDIYSRPHNKFVAEFIGHSNWFSGQAKGHVAPNLVSFQTEDGSIVARAPEGGDASHTLELCVRPERIVLSKISAGSAPDAPNQNEFTGSVQLAQYLGSVIHTWVRLSSGRLVHVIEQNAGQSLRREGDKVGIQFWPEDCILVAH